ncbi:hypothetical protein Leryth_006688 [Lithospermum erythrorhizon]|nr:hypothetical protein Leryth_006688 [Lithospermum erythrorhizon]
MEIARLSNNGGLNRSWAGQSRRGTMSQRVYSTKRTTKVVRLGGRAEAVNYYKLRVATPKLRLMSPVKIWSKFKNAYTNMMLHLGASGDNNAKRIPRVRQNQPKMTNTEFDNRLIYEIYKSLSVSMELRNP